MTKKKKRQRSEEPAYDLTSKSGTIIDYNLNFVVFFKDKILKCCLKKF